MRLVWLVFLLLLVVAACVVTAMAVPEGRLAAGGPYPDNPAMGIGGDGSRFFAIAWPVIIWQAVVHILVAPFLAMGVEKARRNRSFWFWMLACSGLTLTAWLAGMAAYLSFLDTGETSFLLGYPLPTTLTMLGIWMGGLSYALFYTIGYRTYFFTHEEEAAFEDLVREVKQGEAGVGQGEGR